MKKTRKLFCILLTLVMVVGLLPLGQTVYAYSEGDIPGTTGSGTSESDPVVCDTFAEFKAAMEDTEIKYLKLSGANEVIPAKSSLAAAVMQTTSKTLIISGTNTFTAPLNGMNDCLIWSRNGNLVVKGTGTLEYQHGNTGGTGAVIYKSYGSLEIKDNVTLKGSANGATFGRALYLSGGTTTIDGGKFYGYDAMQSISSIDAVSVDASASLTVNGGSFSASKYSGTPSGKQTYGLSVGEGTVVLKGGTYHGISSENANLALSTLLASGYAYKKSDNSIFDGTSVKTTQEVLTVEDMTISEVNIINSAPEEGKTPSDMTAEVVGGLSLNGEWWFPQPNAQGGTMSDTDAFVSGNNYSSAYRIVIPASLGKTFSTTVNVTVTNGTVYKVTRTNNTAIEVVVNHTIEKAIKTVDVTVAEPAAGQHPQDAISNTANVNVSITDWYLNGKALTSTDTFNAGETYRVHVIVNTDSGSYFDDYPTVTFNGTKAGTVFLIGPDYINYYADYTVAAAKPTITTQPSAQTVEAGAKATFKVVATGATKYQWQYSDDGTTWKNCSSTGYNKATFSFKASTSLHNRQYRCVVSNSAGTTTSSAAKLTVVGIKTQPKAQTVAVGAQATFKVVATGATSYQWQWSADGTTWKNCTSSGYNTATFSFKASTALNGRQYRCRITNGSITVTSNAAKLTVTTVSKPTITAQPTNQSVTAGSKATFKVVASGATSYQWQWSANGTTWTDCKSTGYNTNTFAFTASAALNGRQYRCIVTNSAGSTTSNAAKLTVTSAVTKPTITTQPTNKTVASGTSVTFKVVASGTSLTYQWQWSGDNGKTWKNCTSTGYDTASFSFKASAALNGRMYRCIVKNSAGSATSTGAKLTVSNVKPAITVQPTNKTATAGTKVSFSVIAAGSGLKYQWQWSADGTTWTNCKSTGYNTATFTFTASASLNNRQYRCVVSNSYGSTTSSAGKLTVK